MVIVFTVVKQTPLNTAQYKLPVYSVLLPERVAVL